MPRPRAGAMEGPLMNLLPLACLAALLAAAAPAKAVVLLNDDFNAENGGAGQLNYFGLTNWTVDKGTVDLIGQGTRWNFFPGNGLYLDMDGSGIDSGGITSRSAFALGPGSYTLSFMLGGSQRGDTNTVRVALGTAFSEDFTLASNAALTSFTRTITVASAGLARLSFTQLDRRDNRGLILDNVRLASAEPARDITEPATLALIATALLLLAGLRRREGARALG
jgi:hypothetical protein